MHDYVIGLRLPSLPPSSTLEQHFDHVRDVHSNTNMSPHPGIDTDQIKEKARKDLLDLLEGVCKAMGVTRYRGFGTDGPRSEGRRTW
jgi:hypothetical protein